MQHDKAKKAVKHKKNNYIIYSYLRAVEYASLFAFRVAKVATSEGSMCYDFDRFRLYSRDRSQSVSDNAQACVQGAS